MDPSGLHSGREPPASQRPITYGKDIARVTGKDFYRRPKIFLRNLNLSLFSPMHQHCEEVEGDKIDGVTTQCFPRAAEKYAPMSHYMVWSGE